MSRERLILNFQVWDIIRVKSSVEEMIWNQFFMLCFLCSNVNYRGVNLQQIVKKANQKEPEKFLK